MRPSFPPWTPWKPPFKYESTIFLCLQLGLGYLGDLATSLWVIFSQLDINQQISTLIGVLILNELVGDKHRVFRQIFQNKNWLAISRQSCSDHQVDWGRIDGMIVFCSVIVFCFLFFLAPPVPWWDLYIDFCIFTWISCSRIVAIKQKKTFDMMEYYNGYRFSTPAHIFQHTNGS